MGECGILHARFPMDPNYNPKTEEPVMKAHDLSCSASCAEGLQARESRCPCRV